jgi:hypothetical protein
LLRKVRVPTLSVMTTCPLSCPVILGDPLVQRQLLWLIEKLNKALLASDFVSARPYPS